MVKSVKVGLSTLGVFALMMTMAPQAGAQEKAATAVKDKVEAGTSLEAHALANSLKTPNGIKAHRETRLVVSAWYPLVPTSSSSYSNQVISSGTPIDAPPTAGPGCTQNRVTGDFCAIKLQFSGSTLPPLPNNITVQQALSAPYNGVIDTNEDGTSNDGYSRQP